MVKIYPLKLTEKEIEDKAYFDKLRNKVKELGLDINRLLFRGFNGENLETMLKEGTDEPHSEFIYATDSSMVEESGDMNVFEFALCFNNPYIAVYDKNKFHRNEYCYCDDFVFNNQDNRLGALLSVFKLES